MNRTAMVVCVFVAMLAHGVGLFAASPPHLRRSATQYDQSQLTSMAYRIAEEHGLQWRLVHAVITVESDFDPYAVSRKGAQGLMQLMPATAKRHRVSDPFDPEQNIRAGVRELTRLIERYSGNVPLALAAYNAGEGAVERHQGIPPYRETRRYVARIMTMYTGTQYRFESGRRPAPEVRLVDGGDGVVLITNQRPGSERDPAPLLGSFSQGSGGGAAKGVLGGGFGSESRQTTGQD